MQCREQAARAVDVSVVEYPRERGTQVVEVTVESRGRRCFVRPGERDAGAFGEVEVPVDVAPADVGAVARMGSAVAIYQISIALGSVCLLTKKKSFWYLSLALGLLSTLWMVQVLAG